VSKRLLIVNYSMSETNPIFAWQHSVAEKLSHNFQETFVLTREGADAENIRVIVSDWYEGHQIRNLTQLFFSTLRVLFMGKFRYDAIFYHMTDFNAGVMCLFMKPFSSKQVLWYAHASSSRWLRFALKHVDIVVTSTSGSFPEIETNKLKVIGQAIDQGQFKFKERKVFPFKDFVHIGRLDASKNIMQIIDSFLNISNDDSILQNKTLTLIGTPSNQHARTHLESIVRKYANELASGKLKIRDAVQRGMIPSLVDRYDIFLHAFQGSLDKSIVEATFLGIPVLTTNKEYISQFGSWNTSSADISLESQFRSINQLEVGSLQLELKRRRELAIERHSLSGWTKNMSKLLLET